MVNQQKTQGGKTPKVLALIPAYNEMERIVKVIQQTKAYMPVLVVDDGSTDQTSQVSRQAGAEVIRQEPNQGKGAALLNGFRYGIEHGYDAVISLDADGQHDPAEIPLFLQEYEAEGSDLIIGERDFSQMPFPRNITNGIGTRSFSKAMQQYIPDNQSGYRLHTRRLMEEALNSKEYGFEFEVEIILRCIVKDYKLSWIKIKTIYNAKQNSKISPIRHVWRFYRLVYRTGKVIREYKRSKQSK